MNIIVTYFKFFSSFIISQMFSMWGQYYTLKFPNISMIKAFLIAIPFAWIGWIFLTYAIDLSHAHNLLTPIQDIFTLILTQFGLILLINKFYLKQEITNSDYIAFILTLMAFAISYEHVISKTFKIEIPNEH